MAEVGLELCSLGNKSKAHFIEAPGAAWNIPASAVTASTSFGHL